MAATAEEQVRYLDEIFTSVTGGGTAAGYGNDERALELGDIFAAADDMIEHSELTESEKKAIQPLNQLLGEWSGQANADFWRRDALFNDNRWTEVRARAARSLASLPNEERAIGRSG